MDTGFLNDAEQDYFKQPIPWKEATQKLLNAPSSSEADLVAAVSSKTTFKDDEEKARLISGLKWSMFLSPYRSDTTCIILPGTSTGHGK